MLEALEELILFYSSIQDRCGKWLANLLSYEVVMQLF